MRKFEMAQMLAKEAVPDGIGGLSRVFILLARHGAAQIMADAVVGLDRTQWTDDQLISKMRARLDLWVKSVK